MLTATVKGFEKFSEVGADIDALCLAALEEAAVEAAAVAQQESSVPLDIDVDGAAGDVEGFSSGIRSRKTGKGGARIAPFFDGGTLGGRRRKLKQPGRRRDQWQVNRAGTAYTAHRHEIVAGGGIAAEGFFGKARAAGKRKLLARIDRGADAVAFFR